MAGKGINIPLVADVAKFLKGTSDVDQALSDVGDSLDDLSRDAQRTTAATSDAVTDLGRDADTAADRLERSFRDAFDGVRTDSDRMRTDVGDSIGRAGSEGKARAADAGAEIGSELASNLGEAIGSGQANIADILQGTLGGLVSVPGIGIAAAGLGIGVALIKGISDRIAAGKAELAEATQRVFDSIEVDGTSLTIKWDKQKMLTDAIDSLTEGDATQDLARVQEWINAGIGENTIVHALTGELTPKDRAVLEQLVDTGQTITEAAGVRRTILSDTARQSQDLLDLAQRQSLAADDAISKARLLRDLYRDQKTYNEGVNTAIRNRPTVDMTGRARPGTRWDEP